VSAEPGEKNCKWMITGQIELKVFCQWDFELSQDANLRLANSIN